MEALIELLPHEVENLRRQKNPDEILAVAKALAEVEGITHYSPDVWLAQQCPEYEGAARD